HPLTEVTCSLYGTALLRQSEPPSRRPERDRQRVARQMRDRPGIEACFLAQLQHLVVREAEAPVRLLGPERLYLVRREIDDRDSCAWLQHPRRLSQGPPRLLGIV